MQQHFNYAQTQRTPAARMPGSAHLVELDALLGVGVEHLFEEVLGRGGQVVGAGELAGDDLLAQLLRRAKSGREGGGVRRTCCCC